MSGELFAGTYWTERDEIRVRAGLVRAGLVRDAAPVTHEAMSVTGLVDIRFGADSAIPGQRGGWRRHFQNLNREAAGGAMLVGRGATSMALD
jgi:hypothetical protein